MKKFKICILFFLMLFSCTNEKIEFKPSKLEVEFKDTVSDRNKYYNPSYEKYIEDTKKDIRIDNLIRKEKFTNKEVREDLDFFIYSIQTRYALYDRFGGDKEFLKRKKRIPRRYRK